MNLFMQQLHVENNKIDHVWGSSRGVHDRRRVAISDFDLTQE